MAISHKMPTNSNKNTPAVNEKVQQALGSLALEGITFPSDSLHDIELLASGQLSKEEFIKKTLAIAKS